ncbi:MAG: exonuclease subunit SbcD, partial [Myxococcales bacterium]
MRLLHTADWHLGHTLRDWARDHEHDLFLSWLLDTLESEQVDALLVCGDVFDTTNPSAQAQLQWYRFLAQARRRMPDLQVVVIGGNHDAAGRLEAPNPILEALAIEVVGALPRSASAAPAERLMVPLRRGGQVRAWAAAVPFLRPADLPLVRDRATLEAAATSPPGANGSSEPATGGASEPATGGASEPEASGAG